MGSREAFGARYATRRILLLSWVLVSALLALLGMNPDVAHASTLQRHGALVQDDARRAEHGALQRDGIGIISHRGAAAIAPENTLAAMRIAFEQGVDFVETDVQLTADGVPVLMHDETVDRTTSGGGAVARWTLAELRTLDAGGWFSADFAGERVPTFEEFVDELAPTTSRALVELKGPWDAEQVEQVVELLRERHLVNRVALQSFEVPTLEILGEVAPECARVMLTREWDRRTAELAVLLQVSAVGARAKLFDARPELIAEVQALGIGTLVYTLNSSPQWMQAAERGIDLVITDDPIAFAAWREGQ
ncbi:hypothetical protein MUN78_01340 [Leucobacter allii]|uniref:GP-PDE domain-containing protein n=1 Tax=Leucobacter allii TaxID=2932247 RepID=A0ABY4FMN7_9MICO|nr:glycerophosphodiester phosphodiesterase family protein [Leucobacter allii]UOQ57519.1 hypothetical protein MUN78_01340 [Leucobacter allii]UOR01979.1 hypothetical protein MUN77_01215 [Leucobacter allii]